MIHPIGKHHLRLMVVVALLWFWARPALAVRFEQALPGDCILFVNFNDTRRITEQFGQLRFVRLFSDPAMKPFVDNLMTEIEKLPRQLQMMAGGDELSLPLWMMAGGAGQDGLKFELPEGQISLAVRIEDAQPKPIPFVYLFMDVSKREEMVRQRLEPVSAFLEGQQLAKRSVGDLTVFSKGPPKRGEQFCFTVKDGVLAFGNDPQALAQTVGALGTGTRDSLADNVRFRSFRSRTQGPCDFELFFDFAPLVELALAQEDQSFEEANEMLELDKFLYLGLTCSLGVEELESKTQVVLDMDGQPAILDLFHMPLEGLRPEPWVPEDAIAYFSCQWDIARFYEKLMELLTRKNPLIAQMIDQMTAGPNPDQPLLRIEDDLIGPLGNRLTGISDITEIQGKLALRTLFAWQLEDSARFGEFVERLISQGVGLWLQSKEVGGNTVYMFDPTQFGLTQDIEGQPSPIGVIGFTVTDSHFFFTTHVELLDQVLTLEGAGLAESMEYQKVARYFPSKTSLISFARNDEQGRVTWQMLKSGFLVQKIEQFLESEGQKEIFSGLLEALDGSNLPDYEDVKKYFGLSGCYAVMNEEGMHLVVVSPK